MEMEINLPIKQNQSKYCYFSLIKWFLQMLLISCFLCDANYLHFQYTLLKDQNYASNVDN